MDIFSLWTVLIAIRAFWIGTSLPATLIDKVHGQMRKLATNSKIFPYILVTFGFVDKKFVASLVPRRGHEVGR